MKAEVPLTLDASGGLKGTDGCHSFVGSWSVSSDSLLRLTMVQDTLACADTGAAQKISWGMHLLGIGMLRWKTDSDPALGVNTLVLRSDLTGAKLAVFKSSFVVR